MSLLVGDGLLIATPLGSTGYNRSLGGARLPLESSLIAMTGLALHSLSEWSNAVVADHLPIQVDVIDPAYRPVCLETIVEEVHDVVRVRISRGELIPCFFVNTRQVFCDQQVIGCA